MARDFKFIIGLIVMGASASIEREFHRRVPEDVGIVTTRVPFKNVSEQGLLDMIDALPAASRILIEARPDVIAVTSASGSYMKSQEIVNTIQQATGVQTVVPSLEYVKILKSIQARNIALISSMGQELQLLERMYYFQRGITMDKIINIEGPVNYDPFSAQNLNYETMIKSVKEQDFTGIDAVVFDHPLVNLNSEGGRRMMEYIPVPALSMVDVLIQSSLAVAEKNIL